MAKTGHQAEKNMLRSLDALAEFEAFQDELLPRLRGLYQAGATAEDIYKEYEALAAARTVTIAAREVDSGKALSAIREILDRSQGKAKERHEVEHKYARLKDEELDAALLTKSQELEEG